MLKQVRANQIELAVYDTGQGSPVVLVHGFPLDHSMWNVQIELLSQRHRVLAFDLRGFGASQAVPGTTTMQQMADDVAAALDALKITQPVIFGGLSMGGYVGWQFWARHRDRVARLIACDTRAVADTPEAAQGRKELAQRLMAEGPGVVWQAMHEKLFAAATIRQHPKIVEACAQVALHNSPQGMAAALLGMAERPDFSGQLAEITVPTLVLVGEHDAISSPQEMGRIAEAIPGAQFTVIPAAGHMAPLENPAAFNQVLARFCADIP